MSTWSDRRGLHQKGKELHEPSVPSERRSSISGIAEAARRASTSSNSSMDKPASPTSSSASQRRRSSNTPLFHNLTTAKRGSQDYGERRASHIEQMSNGGLVSGWYNATFRGYVNKPSQN